MTSQQEHQQRQQHQQEEEEDARKPRNAAASYRCEYCEVTFTRSEHLKRHQTMHSKLKAFSCPFCGKKFARNDVLNRHYQSCKPAQQADKAPAKISRRVNHACSLCRFSKVKCSGTRPCQRCCSTGQTHLCHFTLRKPRQANSVSGNSTQNNGAAISPEQQVPPYEQDSQQENLDNATARENGTAAVPGADQYAQSSPEPLTRDATNDYGDEPSVASGQGGSIMDSMSPSQITEVTFAMDTTDMMSFSDLGPDMSFGLDMLDWRILDNSLMAYQNDSHTDTNTTTTSVSPSQGFPASENTMVRHDDIEMGGQGVGFSKPPLPAGISIMQISPLDAHRIQILQYLEESGLGGRRWDGWLTLDNMSLFMQSYFSFFHQHTPLLHLPFWNIATASTRLIFSIVLMGAMYSGNLEIHKSEARQLCQLAQSFAWTSDPGAETNDPVQLDTIQAVYIATLLEAFYFPSKKHRPAVDKRKLFNEARNSGVFKPARSRTDPWKLKWVEWSAHECRIRTAFILYLFDAIQAIVFDHPPELHLHELHLPLPCDESVFIASNEYEWQERYLSAQDLTRVEYPAVLSLFFCHRPVQVPLHFSIMGAFIVLHGILLHMWEQKIIHTRKDMPEVPDTTDQSVREHLAAVHSQVIDNALKLWRSHWDRTVSQPSSTASHGLYRDRALVYWFLGNAINRNHGLAWPEFSAVSANGQWTLKIPRLLTRLTVLVDSGQLDVASDGASENEAADKLACHLRDLQQDSADSDAGGDEVDTIALSRMMGKDCAEYREDT